MEVLLLSSSKFSSSAAYSALPAAAVLLPRRTTDCSFKDFLARCGSDQEKGLGGGLCLWVGLAGLGLRLG